ncbi:MAG: M67 family metallopeptidase [Candidatus Hydrogenedentes bacterium]|nr:M67 family metallopeptidase [Candidatus Hydrogenedentota bacterium]
MKIRSEVVDSILFHAQLSEPRECCGILMSRDKNGGVVDLVFWGSNVEPVRPESRYELDHKSHVNAVNMECAGEGRVVGYYHSHPSGGVNPSEVDLGRAVDQTAYLIVGMGYDRPELAAWRIDGSGYVEEPLEICV